MTMDLRIVTEDRPGELARVGEATGAAGVNIEAVAGLASGGQGEIHVVVEDAAAAKAALSDAGITVEGEQEVVVVDCADAPGELGRIARRAADAGANLNLALLATGIRLVLGADDLEALRGAV